MIRKSIACAAMLAIAPTAFGAAPVNSQERRDVRAVPAQPAQPPARSLEQEELPAVITTQCRGVRVHAVLNGLAFTCVNFQEGDSYMIVVREDKAGEARRAQIAVGLLQAAMEESRDYILDPQQPGSLLKVRHRKASTKNELVCRLTAELRSGVECREALALNF